MQSFLLKAQQKAGYWFWIFWEVLSKNLQARSSEDKATTSKLEARPEEVVQPLHGELDQVPGKQITDLGDLVHRHLASKLAFSIFQTFSLNRFPKDFGKQVGGPIVKCLRLGGFHMAERLSCGKLLVRIALLQ